MNRQQIKKWSLLRHLNFKGYKRTASGNPLNMVKVMFPSQLTIYGNAVQDGTPSPDAPVEVQLCGDRTGNLLDVTRISGNQIEVTDNKVYLSGYACATAISPKAFLDMTGLNPGDTITCSNSAEVISGTANSVLGRVAFSTKNEGTSLILCSNNTKTVTIPSDFNNDNYTNLLLYGAQNSDESDEQLAVMSNLAIYKGSYTADTLPAYEPYGYNVSGRVEGLNLLDYTKATDRLGNPLTIIDDGVIWDKKIDYYFYIPCDIKAGTKICFSCKSDYPENEGNSIVAFSVRYTDGTYDYSSLGYFTPTKDVKTFCPRKNHPDDTSTVPIKITDMMLVAGDYTPQTMPPYEPYQPPQDFAVYLPEQIAKVGDVADEVVVDMEKQTAELKKNILQYEHSDNWDLGSNGKNDVTQRFFQIINKYLVANSRGISNVFAELNPSSITIINNDTEGFNCSNNSYLQVRVNKSRLDTVDASGFKSWLAAYEETTPLIIYGEALTPVTTDITSLQQWDAMPNITGTVSITFDSTIPISSAETEYYSKEYDAT